MNTIAPRYRHAVEVAAGTRHVVACVDRSEQAAGVISHAIAIGGALGAPITVLQVLEAGPESRTRPDPIDCDLRRREARALLGKLVQSLASTTSIVDIQLETGPVADTIARFVDANQENLLVLGKRSADDRGRNCISGTVHDVLERTPDSVLLIPAYASGSRHGYRRIVVPLDGSPWAESAVPLAVRIALTSGAELVLAHVTPVPELTEPRPLEPSDLELRRRVVERNELVARDYLERLRRQLGAKDVAARIVLKRGDNVRRMLTRIVSAEDADLIVMSARGHGNREHADVRYGSTASYVMTHAPVPVLVSRPRMTIPSAEATLIASQLPNRMPGHRSA